MTASEAARRARADGVAVRICDLGAWTGGELRAEYDPAVPEIRVNERVAARLSGAERDAFVARAIGHELYHHRERCGRAPALATRADREAAADAFAREWVRR